MMDVQFAKRLSQSFLCALEMKRTEMQEDLAQKILVNATLELISGDRFQKVNNQNLKDQGTIHFCF